MGILHVKTDLWPAYGHYLSGKADALSILAFQIDIMNQQGNLFDAEKGQYFFRDSNIPRPRPATFAAWLAICGLGVWDSDSIFYTPFLPSIRDDEEGGIASHMRGRTTESHLTTLSRKSKLHLRDSKGHIQWGSVYLGNMLDSEYPLYAKLGRSDVPESFIIPRHAQHVGLDARTQGGLRSRMEFLAQYGIPAVYNSDIPLAAVRRLLFQITSLEHATNWARSFVESMAICSADPRAAESDYALMIHELAEARKRPESLVEKQEGIPKTVKMNGHKVKVKMSLADIDISL